VHGSIFRFEGRRRSSSHMRAPATGASCPNLHPRSWRLRGAEAGVLGVLPGIIGSIQAVEAIQASASRSGAARRPSPRYDALEQSFRIFKIRRDPACPACGEHAGEIVVAEYDRALHAHPTKAPLLACHRLSGAHRTKARDPR